MPFIDRKLVRVQVAPASETSGRRRTAPQTFWVFTTIAPKPTPANEVGPGEAAAKAASWLRDDL